MPSTPAATSQRKPAEKPSWYITTAIPFVNGPPHIGFALEMIQADVLARHRRAAGYAVRLQAGTDENSLKNVLAAETLGLDTEVLVGRNAKRFAALKSALNLSVDDFIRTSADPRHRCGVEALWHACAANGDIYKKAYSGLYCVGCEQFYKPEDLPNGCCPEHGLPPEEVAEENYFFRLSRYQQTLLEAVASGELKIEPASRRNEVLRFIESGLEDFSISRSAIRARGWGIPVPGDPGQVIYVWFDALGNYITALGYGDGGCDFARYWCASAAREHVIGKGITRFHAVYWPAMLLSAGLPLPTRIFVHGYVTVEGAKIGKSAGNAVDPVPLADEFGADALRYFLLRHIRSTEDGDFSRDRFLRAYKSELAGQLGNLACRTLGMIDRYFGGVIPTSRAVKSSPSRLVLAVRQLPAAVSERTEAFAFHEALAQIWEVVSMANRHVATTEPWALARAANSASDSGEAALARARLRQILLELATTLVIVGRCLAPYLPTTSDRLLRQLGVVPADDGSDCDARLAGNRIGNSKVLFPKDGP